MAVPLSNFRSPAALARFALTCAIGLSIDLWTKVLAVGHLKDEPPVYFIPNWLHFTYTENHGAVFGIGQGQRWLFVSVSFLAIGFLTWLFANSGRQRFYQFLLGMLLAGVLGNMYDRIVFGHVRDMILALPDWHWPGTWQLFSYPDNPTRAVFPYVFNVADSLLCVGVVLMIGYSWFHKPATVESTDDQASMTNQAPSTKPQT